MCILPAGYRFEKSTTGYVLLARHGEIVSSFYSPEDLDAGTIAAYHALGYTHGRIALKRELTRPLARLVHEARALAAAREQPAIGDAIQDVLQIIDAL